MKKTKSSIDETMLDLFNDFYCKMMSMGYHTIVNMIGEDSYCPNLPVGVVCSKDDKYVPIISLNVRFCEKRIWVHIENRNGNAILNGNTMAIYRVDCNKPNAKAAYEEMIKYVVSKFGAYNKTNKIQFDIDDDKMEKKYFN